MRILLIAALVASQTQGVIIKLSDVVDEICFVIRSEYSKEFVNLSYVVFSETAGGNRVRFVLKKKDSDTPEKEVLPDSNSFQHVIKLENDFKSVYTACFYNPDRHKKSIKFIVDHKSKEKVADNSNFKAAEKLVKMLDDESGSLQDNMFYLYMASKQTAETFTSSQKFFQLVTILKIIVLLMVTIFMTIFVAKFVSKRVRFSNII